MFIVVFIVEIQLEKEQAIKVRKINANESALNLHF